MLKKSHTHGLILLIGLAFLYTPILVLIINSFNQSRLVSYWGGWSFQWYKTLIHDQDVLSAAWLTLRLAFSASSIAIVLATLLAVILKRYKHFSGKTFIYAMSISPIILPDVVSGLALLLLFVSLERLIHWPSTEGFDTILIAHITFCTAYASIIIQSRFASLDKSLEEAALDLGASPTKTFFWITLPQLFPSLLAAWLLGFTLSIDDVVITTFVSGPSNTTLPMYIFSTVKTGTTPELNALATVMILIIAGLLIMGSCFKKNIKIRKI